MTVNSRWVILGDSIQSLVYEASPAVPDATKLTASQIPSLANVSVLNVSAPGNTLANAGGTAGDFSVDANLNVLNLLRGTLLPDGVICFLGTNDYANPSISGVAFIQAYTRLIQYCKSNGMKFVAVTPLWRYDEATAVQHVDGPRTLQDFRSWIVNVTAGEAVNAPTTVKYIHYFDLGLTTGPTSTDYFDGIHITGVGHGKVSAGLLAKMVEFGFWTAS